MAFRDRDAELEFRMIASIGSKGLAAIGLLTNLMRALRAKGVFSDIELLAICDASAQAAKGSGDENSERFAQSVRECILDLQHRVLGQAASEPQKH